MKKISLIVISIMFAACSKSNLILSEQKAIEDGIYLIAEQFDDSEKSDSIYAIKFSELFRDTENNIIYIIYKEFVPLTLRKQPISEEQQDGRKKLYLELSENAVDKLREFTEKYLGRKIAVVIGSKVITAHKIKSIIEEGKIQITRCDDNACEVLFMELKDNVVGRAK